MRYCFKEGSGHAGFSLYVRIPDFYKKDL
jgi:hypothetical protein